MQYIPLPTTDQPLLEITTSLDGEFFTFVYDWNSITDRWSFSVYDASGNSVVSGAKLVANFTLLRNALPSLRPKGILLLISPDDEDANISNIDNCKLVYIEDSELEPA